MPLLMAADPMRLSLRPARNDDEDFLYRLYAGTRQEEVAAWGWNPGQQDAFLRMQFRAQRQGYAAEFPAADHQVIMADQEPVGRLIVHRTEKDVRLVDIAVLSEYRNLGMGTALLRDLVAECRASGASLRLQVAKGNRAIRLYERLGLRTESETEMYYQMSWDPAAEPKPMAPASQA
jgi:ribosomal protein S18 acetylase RimI-like enzyme